MPGNRLYPYLTFDGNCTEAMQFYQKCIGGKLSFLRVGDLPQAEPMPEEMKACILQASLENEDIILLATDLAEDYGLTRGNSISIFFECSNDSQVKRYYKNLSEGGLPTHPVKKTYWGSLFGGLTDKYGHNWLIHCKK